MMEKSVHKLILILSVATLTFFGSESRSQTIVDASIGASFQDDFNYQFAIRRQLSNKFRAGLEFQQGLPKYRFVGTKVLDEGYSTSASLPFSYLIQNQEEIKLYGIGRLGFRRQGTDSPDDNNPDSVLTSNAILSEFGLMTGFKATDRLNLQAGMSFPMAFETTPLELMEYMWVKLHLGGSITNDKLTFFAHSNIGAAFGASGDTYKYIWSSELGIRFHLGELKNENFKLIQTSF